MSVSDKLKTDVAAKNLAAIRDDLWSRIALDPNFTGGFLESWQYCLDNDIAESEIYQEHDGRDIDLEPTGENFDLLAGHLSTNFSKERLDKMKEIGQKLYPVNEENSESQTPAHVDGKTEPTGREPSSDSGEAGLLVAGIVIGAVAGGAIGAAIFGKAVAAAAAGAVIGAAAGGFAVTRPTVREWIGQKLSKK